MRPRPERKRPAPRPRRSLEELLSPRVLALIGGGVTFLGLAFLVALGISQGWIGPEVRVIAAGVLSLALAAAGAVLHSRDERTLGTILVATGIAGAYATLLGATALYGFLPDSAGLVGALAVAAAGTALGVTWRDQAVVALAQLGALAAPILIDVPSEAFTVAYLVAVLGGAAAIASLRRWWGLAAALLALALPQLAVAAFDHSQSGLPGLAIAWLEIAAMTLAPVFLAREKDWRVALWLFAGASSLTAMIGFGALVEDEPWDAIWVFSLAATYLLVALGARRLRPDLDGLFEFALLAGFGLAALGASLVLDGPTLVVAWCVEAALLTVRSRPDRDARSPWTLIASAALFTLAFGHTMAWEAQPENLFSTPEEAVDAAFALGALTASAVAAAILLPPRWREIPCLLAMAVLAYAVPVFKADEAAVALWTALAGSVWLVNRRLDLVLLPAGAWMLLGLVVPYAIAELIPLDGSAELWPALVATLAVTVAGAVGAICSRGAERTAALLVAFAAPAYASFALLDGEWTTLALGALVVLAAHLRGVLPWRRALAAGLLAGTAVAQAVIAIAPPGGLASGTDELAAAAGALLIVAVATTLAALPFRSMRLTVGGHRFGLLSSANWISGTALVYAGSLAVVQIVGGESSTLGLNGVEQPAQVALSAYWAIVGVGAVIAGLRSGRRSLRTAGLALLGLTLGKIFILDLSSLDASYRAISFIAVGLLLLGASFAYRRLARDDASPPDLTELEVTEAGGTWMGPALGALAALVVGLTLVSVGDGRAESPVPQVAMEQGT